MSAVTMCLQALASSVQFCHMSELDCEFNACYDPIAITSTTLSDWPKLIQWITACGSVCQLQPDATATACNTLMRSVAAQGGLPGSFGDLLVLAVTHLRTASKSSGGMVLSITDAVGMLAQEGIMVDAYDFGAVEVRELQRLKFVLHGVPNAKDFSNEITSAFLGVNPSASKLLGVLPALSVELCELLSLHPRTVHYSRFHHAMAALLHSMELLLPHTTNSADRVALHSLKHGITQVFPCCIDALDNSPVGVLVKMLKKLCVDVGKEYCRHPTSPWYSFKDAEVMKYIVGGGVATVPAVNAQ